MLDWTVDQLRDLYKTPANRGLVKKELAALIRAWRMVCEYLEEVIAGKRPAEIKGHQIPNAEKELRAAKKLVSAFEGFEQEISPPTKLPHKVESPILKRTRPSKK